MRSIGGRTWAWLYALIGSVLAGTAISHLLTDHHHVPLFHILAYVSILLMGSGILLYGAYRHYQRPLPTGRYWRINVWIVGGVVFVTAIGILSLYIGSETVTGEELIESIYLLLGTGAAIGFLIGSFEAESLENAEAAARAVALEAERERLQLLNELLRHYVLNGVAVIDGYAAELESITSEAETESVAIIRDRAADMENIVSKMGVLMKTEWEGGQEVAADIGATIREQFSTFGGETTTLELEEGPPPMVANRGYEEAMALFVEAICDATGTQGIITVQWDENDGTISVVARPIDIPESLQEDLLEPVASGIGLELFLAKTVLEPAIELAFTTHGEETIEFILRGEFVEGHA